MFAFFLGRVQYDKITMVCIFKMFSQVRDSLLAHICWVIRIFSFFFTSVILVQLANLVIF